MSLASLVRSGAKIQEISQHLDGLDHARRLEEMYELSASDQKLLYECAADAPPIEAEHFVPADVPDSTQVIHFGKNSQPAFRLFEKRFCRPAGRPGQLWGYNEGVTRPFIGPGYFVARETEGGGSDPRGAMVVDYFLVPDGPVAPGWPAVKPNSKGLQMFVFNQTRDYMRRVSSHVSIGIAYRKESRIMGTFVICREP
jgi:hypothetical protein